jgi:hypothetical protein
MIYGIIDKQPNMPIFSRQYFSRGFALGGVLTRRISCRGGQ